MKINESTAEAQQMAETAINLEQYLKDFIGSFQGLINEVCQQDNNLTGTVTEIQSLVEDIMASKTGNLISTKDNDLSKNMLDFLITNEEKKERLIEAVEEAQKQGIEYSWKEIDIDDCGDLTTTINALSSHIDSKLGEYTRQSPNDSDININYEKLENLLQQGKFKKADEETTALILKATVIIS